MIPRPVARVATSKPFYILVNTYENESKIRV